MNIKIQYSTIMVITDMKSSQKTYKMKDLPFPEDKDIYLAED